MKMKIGRNANEVKFFDDDGNVLNIPARLIDIKLRSDQPTIAYMEVYLDSIDIDIIDDLLDVRRVGHRKAG